MWSGIFDKPDFPVPSCRWWQQILVLQREQWIDLSKPAESFHLFFLYTVIFWLSAVQKKQNNPEYLTALSIRKRKNQPLIIRGWPD